MGRTDVIIIDKQIDVTIKDPLSFTAGLFIMIGVSLLVLSSIAKS